ncbi:hypothetical protein Tco_0584287 [Tanacetum coccineum]
MFNVRENQINQVIDIGYLIVDELEAELEELERAELVEQLIQPTITAMLLRATKWFSAKRSCWGLILIFHQAKTPKKYICSAINGLITSKDHAYVHINFSHLVESA